MRTQQNNNNMHLPLAERQQLTPSFNFGLLCEGYDYGMSLIYRIFSLMVNYVIHEIRLGVCVWYLTTFLCDKGI